MLRKESITKKISNQTKKNNDRKKSVPKQKKKGGVVGRLYNPDSNAYDWKQRTDRHYDDVSGWDVDRYNISNNSSYTDVPVPPSGSVFRSPEQPRRTNVLQRVNAFNHGIRENDEAPMYPIQKRKQVSSKLQERFNMFENGTSSGGRKSKQVRKNKTSQAKPNKPVTKKVTLKKKENKSKK